MTIFRRAIACAFAPLSRDRYSVRATTAVIALLLLFAVPTPASAADDREQCTGQSSLQWSEKIAACGRAIASGKYRGRDLADLHSTRAFLNGWVAQARYMDDPDAARKIAALQLPDIEASVRLAPEQPDYLQHRCTARAELDDLSSALADCNAVIRMRANAAPGIVSAAYAARGFVYLRQKQFDRAIADYTVAIDRFPSSENAIYGRHCARRAKGDVAGANADLAAAKKIVPAIEEVWGKCR